MTFENDNGDASTITVSGDYILKIGTSREAVEESGFGGIPLLSDMEIEIYDRDDMFHDQIFQKDAITKCSAVVNITSGATTKNIIYGDVDLSTIRYPAVNINSDESVTVRTCGFTVYSFLKRLETILFTDFRNELIAFEVQGNSTVIFPPYFPGPDNSSFVTIEQVFLSLVEQLTGLTVSISVSTGQSYRVLLHAPNFPLASNNFTFADLYLLFRSHLQTQSPPLWAGLFTTASGDPGEGTLGATTQKLPDVGDCLSAMKVLASAFLLYPFITYDPDTTDISLILKQRGSGSVVDSTTLGIQKSSEESTFYGYDSMKVYAAGGDDPNVVDAQSFSPPDMRNDQFNLLKQTFTLSNHLSLPTLSPNVFVQSTVDTFDFYSIEEIIEGVLEYTNWNMWLRDKLVSYFGGVGNDVLTSPFTLDRKYPPTMFERRYSGTNMVTDPIYLLDQQTINSEDYSFIEIERDFIRAEKTIKMVKVQL